MRPLVKSAFLLVLFFVFIEGSLNVLSSVKEFFAVATRDAAQYIEHDSLLGWQNTPNFSSHHAFGRSAQLTTNSLGIRNSRELKKEVPSGKKRLVCSGDSFTFGSESSDENTWCALLEKNNSQLETVNLGVIAYGADQAFLRYRKLNTEIDHQIHLFAFITEDFERMRLSEFVGTPKPRLYLEAGHLKIRNYPVKKQGIPQIYFRRVLGRLQIGKLFLSIAGKTFDSNLDVETPMDLAELRMVMLKIFDELNTLSKKKNIRLIAVHLPVKEDHISTNSFEENEFLRLNLAQRGIEYLNLIPEIQKLSPSELESLFNKPAPNHAVGHYSNQGNAYIAAKIASFLKF